MTERPKPPLTLLGMPAFNPSVPDAEPELPFPLTHYADVHVYTPSRSRPIPGGERTPVMLPPPSRAARKNDPTLLLRPDPNPSTESMWVAGAVVCWVIVLLALWLM